VGHVQKFLQTTSAVSRPDMRRRCDVKVPNEIVFGENSGIYYTYVCLCTLNFTFCVGRGRCKRFCDIVSKAALNQNVENAIGCIGCVTGPDGHKEVLLASASCTLIRSRLGLAIKG